MKYKTSKDHKFITERIIIELVSDDENCLQIGCNTTNGPWAKLEAKLTVAAVSRLK